MQEIARIADRQDLVPSAVRPNFVRRPGDATSKAGSSSLPKAFKAANDQPQCLAERFGHLAVAESPYATVGTEELPRIFVLTDDPALGAEIGDALSDAKRSVEVCESVEAVFANYQPRGDACLVVDTRLGLGLLSRIAKAANQALPVIAIIGRGDVRTAVRAIRAGALDCLEKPLEVGLLIAGVRRALVWSHELVTGLSLRNAMRDRLATLTLRERQIMELVLAGHPNKNIAADLCVSQRTVESHRAAIMKKTGARSLPALVRLALAAVETDDTLRAGDLPSEIEEDGLAVGVSSTGTAPTGLLGTIRTYHVDRSSIGSG